MDVNFHYYATYLVAARAGYCQADARVIAHACQMVDDNDTKFKIDAGYPSEYSNYVSQTMNIAKPREDLLRFYLFHHFMPGDPGHIDARRKDGKRHVLNTTPNSKNARAVFRKAKATGNLYMIGIACHMMADTYAHQNFIGYKDDMNAMSGVLQAAIQNIGHADALTKPDEIGLSWTDDRLMKPVRHNNEIFLDAAQCLFYLLKDKSDLHIHDEAACLNMDLCNAFRRWKPADRIHYMKELAKEPEYSSLDVPVLGGFKLPDYDADVWFDDAIINDRHQALKWLAPRWAWKSGNYKQSNWYQFQEAVKAYQDICWSVLNDSVFSQICLKNL